MIHIKKPSPLVGEGVSGADGRGKLEQKRKTVFYKATVNTCLSFSNEVMASEPFSGERSDAVKMSETPYPGNGSGENLVEVARFKYSNLCTQTCPYRLAGSALPSAFGGSEH